jgi:hypothetical protein
MSAPGTPNDPRKHRELKGAIRGQRALAAFADLFEPADQELNLVLFGLTRVDAWTGVVVRASIERHLAADTSNRIVVWEPQDAEVWRHVSSLIGAMPSRAQYCGDQPAPQLDPTVLLPATALSDEEDLDLVDRIVLINAARLAGVAQRERALLREAFGELAEDALLRGSPGTGSPLTCVARETDSNELTTAIWTPGQGLPDNPEPVERLREMLVSSREELGALGSLAEVAERRSVDASLTIAASTARARWRSGRWRYGEGPPVPGFAAGYTLHL